MPPPLGTFDAATGQSVGPTSARAGNLTLLAAGAPEPIAAVKPWQVRIGKTVFVMGGRSGQAQVVKLVNNLLVAATMVTACEGFAMGPRPGEELCRAHVCLHRPERLFDRLRPLAMACGRL